MHQSFSSFSREHAKIVVVILVSFFTPVAIAQHSDCIVDAAQCFKINPLVIKAIIWQESHNQQNIVNKNTNNTIDVGIMQINSIHFNSLNKLGFSESLLRQNSCVNVFSGVWVLKQSILRYGYTWDGIGNYHSHTPLHHDDYVKKIISLIAYKTPLIDKIQVPEQYGIKERFACK